MYIPAGSSLLALNLFKRNDYPVTINHDAVLPILDSKVPQVVGAFQPYLYYRTGNCAVYPAVDALGRVSGGLKPDALAFESGCDRFSKWSEQVYSRAGYTHHRWGIMYAWFLPRSTDYRYMWVNIVMWINCPGNEPLRPGSVSNLLDISYWVEGTYYRGEKWNLDPRPGTPHPRIGLTLKSTDPWYEDTQVTGFGPLVYWDNLPAAAKKSLNEFDFGLRPTQKVPFNDHNFAQFMSDAYEGKKPKDNKDPAW